MKHQSLINQIAYDIQEAGGRAMLVGGCVRDEIMHKVIKDVDIEVYGLQPEELRTILLTYGKVDEVGASFQVFKLMNDFDISIPRKEKKVSIGHKGFEVTGDPYMSFEEACSRRDFTINAIMKDPLTGEVVDPFNGVIDIERQMLKVVSDKTFQEDSLRVLRLVQFASRFDFDIDPDTFRLALHTDLSDLPKERIWMEIEKMFMKSADPALGLMWLQSLDIENKLFPSHITSMWMKDTLKNAVTVSDGLSYEEKLTVILSVFCYSSLTPCIFDELGVQSVNGYPVRKRTEEILDNIPIGGMNRDYDFHKLSQKANLRLMGKVISTFPTAKKFSDKFTETVERLGIGDEPVEPIIKGRHLIELGIEPSPELGKALAEIYDRQLHGVSAEVLQAMAKGKAGKPDVPADQ